MIDLERHDRQRSTYGLVLLAVIFTASLLSCGAPQPTTPEPTTLPAFPDPRPDGPLGDLHGVLVQITEEFRTSHSNDAVPDFDLQRYDTDGAWSPELPDRIVIPDEWDQESVIFHVRAAWSGHTDEYVELKLYCGAERPIGDDQEDKLVAVVQHATNPASPFVELTTPPLPVEPGTECMIAFKTPGERTLIPYGSAATLFGAYVP